VVGDVTPRKPITGIAFCCARMDGAAVIAPANKSINSRRLTDRVMAAAGRGGAEKLWRRCATGCSGKIAFARSGPSRPGDDRRERPADRIQRSRLCPTSCWETLGATAGRGRGRRSASGSSRIAAGGDTARYRAFAMVTSGRREASCTGVSAGSKGHPRTPFRNSSILAVADFDRSFGNSVKPCAPPG
jgi:hypothetical protein